VGRGDSGRQRPSRHLECAIREGEHGEAFAEASCELGYTLLPAGIEFDDKMEIASSTSLTDREKFEKLGLSRDFDPSQPDVFSKFFDDKTIDIQTGALLGRYIAEERDSGRMLRGCYDQLCAAENGHATRSGNGDLSVQLGRIETCSKLVAKRSDPKRPTVADTGCRVSERAASCMLWR
jgi:hypothetical protein